MAELRDVIRGLVGAGEGEGDASDGDGFWEIASSVKMCANVLLFALVYTTAYVFIAMRRRVDTSLPKYQVGAKRPGSGLFSRQTFENLSFCSRVMGTVHSSIVVPMGIVQLIKALPVWMYFTESSQGDVNVMQITLAYFIVDSVHFVLVEPDFLLCFHHAISLWYNYSVLMARMGSLSAVAAIVMGEITNPLQSMWFITKTYDPQSRSLQRAHELLSHVFTSSFLFMRAVVVPVWVMDVLLDLWDLNESRVMIWFFVPRLVEKYNEHPEIFAEMRGPGLTMEDSPVNYIAWSILPLFMTIGGWVWSYKLMGGYMRKYHAEVFKPKAPKKTPKQILQSIMDKKKKKGKNGKKNN